MTTTPPPPAAAAAHQTNTAAADQATGKDEVQAPEPAAPTDAPAAPADGQAPDTGVAPADAAAASASPDAPPTSDGTAPPADADAAAPSLSGENTTDDTSTHGASFGGHGSFAQLRSENHLGLLATDDHRGIERDVPALHLFEAAGALAPTSDGTDPLPNSAELHTAVAPDDSHDQSSGPINNAPIAHDDVAAICEDGVLIGASVLANDSDADNDKLKAELVDGPAHGALTLNLDGTFVYAPDNDYNGSDFFTYKAVDSAGAVSGTATVALTVTGINDAPIAGADGYSIGEDGKLVVGEDGLLVNDSDAHNGAPGEDNGPLTVTLVEGPAHGELTLHADGSFAYTPDADFNGKDTFTYQAVDGLGAASDAATVALTVTSVNDAPVAANDCYHLGEDGTLVVEKNGLLVNDTDFLHGAPGENNGPLTAALVEGPAHGSLTLHADGTFAYAPDADYNGSDSFTYQAIDGLGAASHAATVSLTIASTNDAPVAVDDHGYSVAEDGVLVVAEGGLLVNDSDGHHGAPGEGNGPLTAALVEGPAHGALTIHADGTFSYTPDADYNGSDSFTYQALDSLGAASEAATVSIAVTSVNDAAVATGDSYSIAEDGTLVVDGGKAGTVLDNDSDALGGAPDENNGPLTAALVLGPAHGSLTFNADGTFVYAPNADYNGADSFTYQAVDGHGAASHAATVSLTVTAVNDAPVAAADSYDVNHDSTLSVAAKGVLTNDSDIDGNSLTAALVDGPAHGSLTFSANGSFSYTPENGFDGTDSFTYRANDGHADSGTATVSLHVIDGNDYLIGTSGHDVLNGGHGNDVIYGQGSGDELNGGPDDDQIYGGSDWWWDNNDGADTIDGGTGNDHVYGSTGNDSISGGDGSDYLYGNTSYSYYYDFYFSSDDDAIDGGKGDDHIYGGNGNDTINGGEGNDYIAGNSDDIYYGYYYDNYYGDNDWIDSGAGNDTINCSSSYYEGYYGYGNSDNDTIAVSSLNGCDLIEGFDGNPSYGQDVLTLAPLFDALAVANEDRAGRVQIDNASPGIWNVNVDVDGDSGNGFETMVAQIQSSDTITIGQDVLVSLAA